MDGTIFGDDIEVLDEAIVKNGEYEFSNVVIKSTPEAFRARSGDYQMSFNGSVRIKPLDLSACSTEPQHRTLSKIPRDQNDTDELIDLVGVVLYVSEVRTIKREEVEDKIRDILIADQRESRPLKISAWNDAAQQDAAFFHSWPETFSVVGFTNVRPITNRDISLVTRSLTAYVEHPTGDVVDEVRVWASQNKDMLKDWCGKAILIHSEAWKKTPVPVDVVLKKKASTIWQDEKFWIQVMMPSLEEKDVFCYTGCNKCGRSFNDKLGTKFVCSRCHNQDVVAVARFSDARSRRSCICYVCQAAFAVILIYVTESIFILPVYKQETLKRALSGSMDILLGNSCQEKVEAFKMRVDDLKKKEMLRQIALANALFHNNMLKWIVRVVEVPPEAE